MTTPADDDLRRRVQELGRGEAAGAPPFDRTLRAAPVARASGRAVWLRPVAALMAVGVVALAAAWWHPAAPATERTVASSRVDASPDVTEGWTLPTDGLLLEPPPGAAGADVDRLSREIEGLLQP